MTICIAAICRDVQSKKWQPSIVLCTDSLMGGPLGRSETAHKQRTISKNWYALTSGYESDISALFMAYKRHIGGQKEVNETNIAQVIRTPLQERKHEKMDEHIRGRFGISYDEFLKTGKERFPAEIFRDVMQAVERIELRASFVIAGFLDDGSAITCQTDDFAKLSLRDHFATVGEGTYLATSVLFKRKQHEYLSLGQTLYNVYEAKRYAEGASSVGPSTEIAVIEHNSYRSLDDDGLELLQKWYEKYGPKEIDEPLVMPDTSYYPF